MEDEQYEIIAGERRYRAMKKLKMDRSTCNYSELNDKETASLH